MDRLNAPEPSSQASQDASDTWLNSLMLSASRILNSRPGGAQSCPHFGLEDMNNTLESGQGITARIAAGIGKALLEQDPRLLAVDVRPAFAFQDQTELTFEVYISVQVESQDAAFKFDLVVENNRKFIVSGIRSLD